MRTVIDREVGAQGGGVSKVPSPASDAVLMGDHPTWADGGPCDGCAFRLGTEAQQSEHTQELARLCVEGARPFYCHEQPGLCRGFVAAMNLRGVPDNEEWERWAEVAGMAADILGDAIDSARAEQERAIRSRQPEPSR